MSDALIGLMFGIALFLPFFSGVFLYKKKAI